jgi:monoamine oxidase
LGKEAITIILAGNVELLASRTSLTVGDAYAFYRPGQWFNVRPILERPHQRVAFAGEHLSEAWQGFIEGAIERGEAAADVV